MSSLAAVQADGFYRPPDWDGKKSLRQITGSKGHNQYLQSGIIRFELPYNSWCLKCSNHLGKGVRFNAKKLEAGKYFSTKIWEFQMKCPNCQNLLVIRTDPKNCDYEMVEGIKRRDQEYAEEDIGLQTLPIESSSTAVSVDPLVALEKSKDDQRKANTAAQRLQELKDSTDRLEADNYGTNVLLRRHFREDKKERAANEEESRKLGLRFDLVQEGPEDRHRAYAVALAQQTDDEYGFKMNAKKRFAQIMGSSILEQSTAGSDKAVDSGVQSQALTSLGASRALTPSTGSSHKTARVSKAKALCDLKAQLAVKRAKLGIKGSALKSMQLPAVAGTVGALNIGIGVKRKASGR